ncbi:hypothetical protein, variant [Aphanomyces invadans]|uniref:Uncharacterized protein n=1 Tax=Aphanomyces invadans TaxID=157072 RepID=A0A024U680_9STRA|nr:hypothetical protein, variant [Aphanomyces invadans]ETW01784.1 hypothetical protein, variant [Aphanomyces invadans]|eukprot:XP_008869632.1 hypothetical protein, variant [Aphanomyces invadans]
MESRPADDASTDEKSSPHEGSDQVMWPNSTMPLELLSRLQTPDTITETDDFPWPYSASPSNTPQSTITSSIPDPTLPHIPVPVPPVTPSQAHRIPIIEKPKVIKIPPAEQEITRLRRESYVMFLKKKREQNVQPPATRNALRDLPLTEIPLFVPPDRIEDEVMASNDCAAVEEWVNAHLTKGNTQLIPVSDAYLAASEPKKQVAMYQSKLEYSDVTQVNVISSTEKTPLQGAGIDSTSLLRLGMPKPMVERIYRGLFVYTSGFHTLIHDLGRHCPAYAESHIAANIWLAFLHLLEKCEDGRYEMAMLKFNHATSIWKKNKMKEYELEKEALTSEVNAVQGQLLAEKNVVADTLTKLADQVEETRLVNEKMQQAQRKFGDYEDDIRMLRLEIMDLEDKLAQKTEQQNQTSSALSLALTQKSDVENEVANLKAQILILQDKLEKHEVNKVRTSNRIRELQSSSQALRDNVDALKNDVRLLTMDKTKLTADRMLYLEKSTVLDKDLELLKIHAAEVTALTVSQKHDIDERDATILSLKNAMEADRNAFVTLQNEIARLTALTHQQKLDNGVLEAQTQLLLIEKNNASQKEGDKARIERLLNKKVELEKEIDLLRQEKEQGQEQIWNLRASLEALENDLHHSKRAYANSQTSLAQAERICEHMRGQLQEMERANDRLTSTLASQKQQSKLLDDASREQVEKMEMELRVVMGQMREMVYTRRENEAQINDLSKSLEANAVEMKLNKQRIEKGDKALAAMTFERDTLLRDKRIAQLEHSTNQAMVNRLNQATSQLMEKIRLNEVNYDEAMQELKMHYDNAFRAPPQLSSSASGVDLHSTHQKALHPSINRGANAVGMQSSVSGLLDLIAMQAGGDGGEMGGSSYGNKPRLSRMDSHSSRPRRRSLKGGAIPRQNEYTIVELTNQLKQRDATIARMEETIEETRFALKMENVAMGREKSRTSRLEECMEMAENDYATLKVTTSQRHGAITMNLLQVQSDLKDYKARVHTLRAYLREYKTHLDHMGMHAEDSRGSLMIVRQKFITRLDEEVQATEEMTENTTQTYPPRRSPVKERAKLKQTIFCAPELAANDVLNNITDLLPDEELDNHFFSLTHHGELATREYRQGYLLESHRVNRFQPLPQLSSTSPTKGRSADPPSDVSTPHLRSQIAVQYRNEFGFVNRVAETNVSPFVFDGVKKARTPMSVAEKLARELQIQENERLMQEISGDNGKVSSSRPPGRPSPGGPKKATMAMQQRKGVHQESTSATDGTRGGAPNQRPAPPTKPKKQHQHVKPRPNNRDNAAVSTTTAQTEVESDLLLLESLRAREHATPYTPEVGQRRREPQYDDEEYESDDDGLNLGSFFVEEGGMLKRRAGGMDGQRIPTLLEQKVKESRANEAMREAASPTLRLVGWELGRQGGNSDASSLPPILYPITKS